MACARQLGAMRHPSAALDAVAARAADVLERRAAARVGGDTDLVVGVDDEQHRVEVDGLAAPLAAHLDLVAGLGLQTGVEPRAAVGPVGQLSRASATRSRAPRWRAASTAARSRQRRPSHRVGVAVLQRAGVVAVRRHDVVVGRRPSSPRPSARPPPAARRSTAASRPARRRRARCTLLVSSRRRCAEHAERLVGWRADEVFVAAAVVDLALLAGADHQVGLVEAHQRARIDAVVVTIEVDHAAAVVGWRSASPPESPGTA